MSEGLVGLPWGSRGKEPYLALEGGSLRPWPRALQSLSFLHGKMQAVRMPEITGLLQGCEEACMLAHSPQK